MADPIQRHRAWSSVQAGLFGEQVAPLRLGRYALRERLGVGGGGMVHLAHDPDLDRQVALKLLHARRGHSDQLLAEARAMARCCHANCVAIHDVGSFEWSRLDERAGHSAMPRDQSCDRGVYLVMEFIDGPDFDEWADQHRRNWKTILGALVEIGRGLAFAHEQGIVHGDVKPANIKVDHHGRPHLLDFGLASALPDGPRASGPDEALLRGTSALPAGGVGLRGSPAFMAPEQHRGHEASESSDQYAFCVVALDALRGSSTFACSSLSQLERAKFEARVQGNAAGMPAWLWRLLLRGLSPDPRERHASMATLLDAIEGQLTASKRTRLGLVAGVLSAAAALSLAVGHQLSLEQVCHEDQRAFERIWNPEQRTRHEQSFTAADAHGGFQAWTLVERELEAYANEWKSVRVGNCRAAIVEGTVSMSAMGRSHHCLDRRLRSVEGYLDLLGDLRSSDVAGAVRAAGRLPSPKSCQAELQAPLVIELPSVQIRAQILEVERTLAASAASVAMARYDRGLELASSALESAQNIGHHATTAAAWRAVGVAQAWHGESELSRSALEESLYHARLSNDERELTRTLTRMMVLQGIYFDDAHAARRSLELARAATHSGRVSQEEIWNLEFQWTRVLEHQGEIELAMAGFEQSLSAARRDLADIPKTNDALNHLGIALGSLGQHQRARQVFERVWRQRRELLGDSHPLTAIARGNVGVEMRWNADPIRSISVMRDAVATISAGMGREERIVAGYHGYIGEMLVRIGEPEQALYHHREAYEIAHLIFERDHADLALATANLAATKLALGHPVQALELAEGAVELTDGRDEHPTRAHALVILGQIQRELGAHLDALAVHDEALEVSRAAHGGQRNPFVVPALYELARSQLAVGQAFGARELLREGLELLDPREFSGLYRDPLRAALNSAQRQLANERSEVVTPATQSP